MYTISSIVDSTLLDPPQMLQAISTEQCQLCVILCRQMVDHMLDNLQLVVMP